jgi:hypothetical protein
MGLAPTALAGPSFKIESCEGNCVIFTGLKGDLAGLDIQIESWGSELRNVRYRPRWLAGPSYSNRVLRDQATAVLRVVPELSPDWRDPFITMVLRLP